MLLWRTVEDADIRVLPMVRFNPSGDLKWLGPNYRPQRDVRLIADEEPGSRGCGPQIRGAALDLLGSKSARSDERRVRPSGSLKA